MSKTPTMRARPVSPHLQIYRLTPTMLMSGLHRITGICLYFGVALFAAWILVAAVSRECFETLNALFGSILGRLVLLGFTWSLIHHMLGGMRHFIWDLGYGLEKDSARRMAIATAIGSLTLTLVIWVIGYAIRGAF